ncbi:MAG: hydrogenase maturation protease [bacterium]|nr:hydrogenase maturation protease [bacterium]
MKTLILGLGNPILSDDGVGVKIVQELKKVKTQRDCFADARNDIKIEIKEGNVAGISILDEIAGYDRLMVIDSIKTGKGKPGDVYKLKIEDLVGAYCNTSLPHLSYSHGVDFATVIKLGEKLGYKLPKVIDIYGIEIENNTTFSENCTKKVKTSIPKVVKKIMEEL